VVVSLGHYKDGTYMDDLFSKVIEEVGVDSCVQIITNNTLVCKVENLIVETKYSQVLVNLHCVLFEFST
jgi:hypothetical protein